MTTIPTRTRRRRPLLAIALLSLAASFLAPPAGAGHASIPSGRTTYRTLAELQAEMASLAAARPDLVRMFELPFETVNGRTVYGLEISHDVGGSTDDPVLGKPVYAVVGLHHGNEKAATELPMEYALSLVQEDGVNPETTRLLDEVTVVVVPAMNADGHAANTRQNANGVDINRNYGLGWRPDSLGGSGPFSEPETRNMEWLFSTRQIVTAVTMHTCINIVLYPPLQHVAGLTEDHDRFVALGGEMAGAMGSTHSTSADDYETTGEMIDWTYYATRGLNFTIETCTESGESSSTYHDMVLDEWAGVREALADGLRHASDAREHATITGDAPAGAVLRISKEFDLWTGPLVDAPGNPDYGQEPVPTYLESELVIPSGSGNFTWEVNPSRRPVPAYRSDGIHTGPSGFYDEAWQLTCGTADGRVLQSTDVFVDLGGTASVDLTECRRKFGEPEFLGLCKGQLATVAGTDEADRVYATPEPDVIRAGKGADTVLAGSGADIVCGGGGRDRLKGARGGDLLVGGPAADKLLGGDGVDTCRGGELWRSCEAGLRP